jgi:cephalosporin-C deacetylase-like acetyl esterase
MGGEKEEEETYIEFWQGNLLESRHLENEKDMEYNSIMAHRQ